MASRQLWIMFTLLCLVLTMAGGAQAAAVGRFTLVEGQVDMLKHGQVPGAPAKLNDGVEPGDVIRTKSKAKAQVKFVDDSVVTLAPESRIAVADFTFDAASGERHAVLRFFKGVLHTLISSRLRVQEPDFLMETHTAVLGVRGTETYTLLLPSATVACLINGLLEVRSNNPQIPASLALKGMEFTMIPLDQGPRPPKDITPAMLEMLKSLMSTGLSERVFLGAGAGPPTGLQIPGTLGIPGVPEQYMQPSIPPQVVPPAVTPQAPSRGAPGPGPTVP